MDELTKAKDFGDILERVLDGEPVEVGDEDLASLLEVARRLQREAPVGEPDPEFQAGLRAELVDGGVKVRPFQVQPAAPKVGREHPLVLKRPGRAGMWQWWRLGAACVALVLVAALTWLGAGLRGEGGVNADLARLPSLLGVASAYAAQIGEDAGDEGPNPLGQATFRLIAALPKAPDRAKVYRQAREPIDEAGARALAGRLGIVVKNVVDDPDYGAFVVAGDGGRLVVSKAFRGYFSFETDVKPGSDPFVPAPPPPALAPPGAVVTSAPDDAEAMRAALEFLRARDLLGFEHLVEAGSDAPPGDRPVYRQVTFTPTVEGRPVRGLGVVVTVGPGGRVTAAQSAYAQLIPGQAYPIVAAEEAYQQLEEKRLEAFRLQVRKSSASSAAGFSSSVSSVFRSAGAASQPVDAPAYRVGEAVELEGLLSATVFEAKDGRRRYNATLLAGPRDARTRVQYRLVGPAVEELAQLDQQHVRVWGLVQGLSTRPPGGRLLVERYEKLYPQERLVTLLGRLQIEGERDEATLVLVTDDGQKYLLEGPGGVRHQREYQGRWTIVEGRTTERTSKAGYPVIELAGMQSGSDIDSSTDISSYRTERPRVVPEREPLLSGEVAVERAALEYYATAAAGLPPRFAAPDLEPFLLAQPIYSFSGTFDQGRGSFEAQVPAVRPEYVEKLEH